jgi:hypothetical protein
MQAGTNLAAIEGPDRFVSAPSSTHGQQVVAARFDWNCGTAAGRARRLAHEAGVVLALATPRR